MRVIAIALILFLAFPAAAVASKPERFDQCTNIPDHQQQVPHGYTQVWLDLETGSLPYCIPT